MDMLYLLLMKTLAVIAFHTLDIPTVLIDSWLKLIFGINDTYVDVVLRLVLILFKIVVVEWEWEGCHVGIQEENERWTAPLILSKTLLSFDLDFDNS